MMRDMRGFLRIYSHQILLVCIFAFLIEGYLAFGLFFSPGWANGWPIGMDRDTIWLSGLTLMAFVLIVTFSVGICAAVTLQNSTRKK